jgi:thiol-disulfide isomerase/thioredoxin
MKRLVPVLVLVAAIAVALVLTTRGEEEQAAAPQPASVPRINVAHLDGSAEFALAELASAPKPTLLWFWAPWCSICAAEAASVEELAQSQDLRVIAIGGRDEAANGPAFVERFGVKTPTILFDEPMAVWNHYKIPAQPGAVLLDREGRERGRWLGPFENEEVLAAARAL